VLFLRRWLSQYRVRESLTEFHNRGYPVQIQTKCLTGYPGRVNQKKEIESMRQNESNLTMTTDVAVTTNTTNMEEKGMKGFFKNMKKKVLPAVAGSVTGAMLMTSTCFAAGTGTTAVTQPLENLKTLVIAVIGAVGVIILAKNVMEFAQAYQQQDSSTMNSALKGIVAGVMMAGISTVLTFLGF
jgi:hypothetical protein